MTLSLNRTPIEFDTSGYVEVKDPCPVFDGRQWHLFGTGITGPHQFELLHATAPDITGPWSIVDPVDVSAIEGTCVGAPGAVVEDSCIHLFVQTDYNEFGGRIEHLVSADAGVTFERRPVSLTSRGKQEAGIYDAHPALVSGRRYLAYSAFSVVGEPDIHLAEAADWDGPWRRHGAIAKHEHVSCHNQRGGRDYEWGLEGPQLVELPDGRVLLNAVCFQPGRVAGSRQRVFFAIANDARGPYDVLGPVLTPLGGDAAGENGHATAMVVGDELALFFQERDRSDGRWRYGLATMPVHELLARTSTGRAA